MSTSLNLQRIRQQFPALNRKHDQNYVIYTDGPAGSQVPLSVAQAMHHYLMHRNANHGGCFATSIESDALLLEVRRKLATFLNVSDPDCIVFGNNMTSLTFALSRAIAETWNEGDEIILSHCDHDANVTPWALAARDRGAQVKWLDIDPTTCALNLDTLQKSLSSRTRLVAVGMASNAVGTVHPVTKIAELAHAAGALVFLDAVHYAPHLLIDAPATGADFIACSAYKFFGPHVGILWGQRQWLEAISPYKVRPASNTVPDRWMTGTQNHEGIAGVGAAIDYLASLASSGSSLREMLVSAYDVIAGHEHRLGSHFLQGVAMMDGYRVVGHGTMQDRVSTFGILHERLTAQQLSTELAARGIYSWAGNFYAQPLTERLGLEPDGMLRIGFLHYNTIEEVDRVLIALQEIGNDEA